MLRTITSLTFSFLLFTSLALAQFQLVEKIVNTGDEVGNVDAKVTVSPINIPNQVIKGKQFTWEMHEITDLKTGYDLQSNSSAQQLWYDHTNNTLNAVFTTSQQTTGWTDRTCTYFYSMDGGVNWTNVGNVPPPATAGGAHSGFPAIHGLSFPSVVIMNHSAFGGGQNRAQVFINSAPGEYDFVNFDPGMPPDPGGGAIWPRLTVSNDDSKVIFGASINLTDPPFFQYTNVLDINGGTFTGFQYYDGDQAETLSLAVAEDGTVGHLYLGREGEVFYRESEDNGETWGSAEMIFEPYSEPGDTNIWGSIRGLDLVFIGNTPCAVFEVYYQTSTGFFPALNSDIRFWSPTVTGDTTWVIADTNNVPYYQHFFSGDNHDVMCALARPVIGKSIDDRALFVAFQATTENRNTTLDSTTHYAGYFMMSTDSGKTWTTPEKFTPETPSLDWDWASIAEKNPVSGDVCTVHIVMQGDPNGGSQVNGSLPGVTAGFYHFSAEVDLPPAVGVNDDYVLNNFSLEQNYPNPFNPTTSIKFSLAERSNVVLKVYDVLGKEVATLVNGERAEGVHEITFDASDLSSGLYIYTINAGGFTATKKMMLLK